jgi:hypothetical protein
MRTLSFASLCLLAALSLPACTNKDATDLSREVSGTIAKAKRAHVESQQSVTSSADDTDEAAQAAKQVTPDTAQGAADVAQAVAGSGKNGAQSAVHNKW